MWKQRIQWTTLNFPEKCKTVMKSFFNYIVINERRFAQKFTNACKWRMHLSLIGKNIHKNEQICKKECTLHELVDKGMQRCKKSACYGMNSRWNSTDLLIIVCYIPRPFIGSSMTRHLINWQINISCTALTQCITRIIVGRKRVLTANKNCFFFNLSSFDFFLSLLLLLYTILHTVRFFTSNISVSFSGSRNTSCSNN